MVSLLAAPALVILNGECQFLRWVISYLEVSELRMVPGSGVEDEEGEVLAGLSEFRVDGVKVDHLFVGLDEGGHYYQLITDSVVKLIGKL